MLTAMLTALGLLFVLMVICVIGMLSCIPAIGRQNETRRQMKRDYEIKRAIDATSWLAYHPRKGPYRRRT